MQTQQDPPRPQAHPCQELLLPASGGDGPRRPSPQTELPTYNNNNNPKTTKQTFAPKWNYSCKANSPTAHFRVLSGFGQRGGMQQT